MALSSPRNWVLERIYYLNSCSATGGIIGASALGRMIFWGGTAPVAGDTPAPGSIWMDTTNALLKYNTGTAASPTWTSAASSSPTLQQAFAAGKVITGASSQANAMRVGDGTDYAGIYALSAGNTVHLEANSGSTIELDPDAASGTGTVNVNGVLVVDSTVTSTGNFTVGANKVVVTAATGAIATASSLTSTLSTGNAIVINTNKFLVAADTGNTTVAGTLGVTGAATLSADLQGTTATFSGLVTCSGGLNAGALYMDALAAATTDGSITIDGSGTGGVNICSISTGGITLSDDTTLASAKALTLTGANGSAIFTITAGDAAVSAGSLAVTDDDNATSFSVTNSTLTSAALVTLTSTSLTSGKAISVTTDGITSGVMLYLDNDQGASFTGKYIECFDGTADDFIVELHGKTTIAGSAAGTDALILTKGDILVTDGHIDITAGNLTLADGEMDITGGAAQDVFDIIPAADGAVFDINLPASYNLAGGAIDIDGSTGSGPVVEVAFSSTYTGDALSLNMTNAVGAKAVDITGAGTRTASLVHITDVPNNGAVCLDLDTTCGHANARVIDIDEAGTSTNDVISVDFSGAFAGDALNITMTNAAATAQAIVVDGTLTPQAAVVSLSASGVPNGAGRILECSSAGNLSATNVGAAARFLEAGAAQATSYAVQIDSTSNEALNVSTGKSHFAESCTFLESNKAKVATNYVQAGGVNNAITVATNPDDTGTNIPLTDGLMLYIDLNTLTLQAGANTLDYIGGGAVSIVSHFNVANNLGTAYAAGGTICLMYSSGASVWMDMSQ